MNIRFVSSLTAEDENAIAPTLLKAISGVLSLLPIAYSLRIDTSDAHAYEASSSSASTPPAAGGSAGERTGNRQDAFDSVDGTPPSPGRAVLKRFPRPNPF